MRAKLWTARGFAWKLAVVLAFGCVFGVTNHLIRAGDDECDPIDTIEGPLAQDTNKDGIATIAEGMVDLNGDGVFGEFEAQHYGMNCFICWAVSDNCGPTSGASRIKKNSACLQNWRTKKWKCSTQRYVGQDCEVALDGSWCKTH
jgi:hypothetical protein